MKTINVTFTDKEYARLLKVKIQNSWHAFIMSLVPFKKLKGGLENGK